MSFYTSLNYFRPQPPPRVTTRELAAVIQKIYATGAFTSHMLSGIRVKFGRSIDKDARGTIEEIPTGTPGVYSVRSIEFDINHDGKSCPAMIAELNQSDSLIYRAEVQFGSVKKPISSLFTRTGSPENSVELCLWDFALHFGPVYAGMLGEDKSRHVGWMGLSLSGNGYLFPWKRAEVLKRAEHSAELQQLAQICSDAWPIDPHTRRKITNVGNLLARTRKALGKQDVNTLTAWQWDVHESG